MSSSEKPLEGLVFGEVGSNPNHSCKNSTNPKFLPKFVGSVSPILKAGMQHFKLELHLNSRKKARSLEEMAAGCRLGDSRAQRELYDALSPKMFALCIRYMGDRDAAQDVLQDGFVTLFSKIDSYSGAGSFEGWARTVFVSTALMALRKKDLLRDSEDIDAARGMVETDAGAIQDIGYKELLKMVAELPAGFRTVFNMYVMEGYSHKEIAEALDISEVTSRSQLQRARVLLQKKILERERTRGK